MLPKAVRARKHFEVGGFIEERAGDRTDEVVALLAEHYGARRGAGPRGALRGRRARSPSRPRRLRFLEAAGDAAAAFYSNSRGVRRTTSRRAIWPRDDRRPRAHRREAGRRRAAARPGRRGHRGVGGVPRVPPHATRTSSASPTCTARSAPGSAHKGERKAAIEHHQKGINLLKDGPPRPRARAPLRGGRLALHADGRQHARDLRVREGAAPGRAAGGDARGLAARTASSAACSGASATPRRRARTWSGRSSSPAAPTTARRSSRCSRSAITWRSPRPTTAAPRPPTARALALAERGRRRARAGRAARRAGPARRLPRRLGGRAALLRCERPALPSARAWSASCACRRRCAGCCTGATASWDEAERLYRRAHELAEQVGWSEVAFTALFGLSARAARPRRRRRRR